jgi:acid phosphatase
MKASSQVLGLRVALLICTSIAVPLASGQASPQAEPATLPSFGHVFVVVGENLDYRTTYNSKHMPYLTSLANSYGLATNYYSSSHPSIGNYFNLTTGAILTDDDSQTPSSFPVSRDNIAYEVQQAGKTWKDYVENDPNISGCGGHRPGAYYVRHDPLEYMTDVNTQKSNYVCFSQFATDLKDKALPNLSWLVPNGYDDAHDSTAKAFDNWLKAEIAPLLASSYFQTGGDGLLIVAFDENATNGSPDCETTTEGLGCGGQVETVLISPYSIARHKQTSGDPQAYNKGYDEGNILRTIAQGLGLPTTNLGWADTAVAMTEFFQ